MRSALALVLVACGGAPVEHVPQPPPPDFGSGSQASGGGSGSSMPAAHQVEAPVDRSYDRLSRADFNRFAVRTDYPFYWIADTNNNKTIDADEVVELLFYPLQHTMYRNGNELGPRTFGAAYARILEASTAKPTDKRLALVLQDLDQGRPSLVYTDTSAMSDADKKFITEMMKVGGLIDTLYAKMNGSAALADKLPADDLASQSLFRRNHGPQCVGPATESDPECSALAGSPKLVYDIYPATVGGVAQSDKTFCATLEKQKVKGLLDPFTVVREDKGKLVAVPYNVAYKDDMDAIANELAKAADTIQDPNEVLLVGYLRAAAKGFRTNDWLAADEAWAKMGVDNSKWYVRAAPDETYWEPCSHKASMHLTFARINQGSVAWQKKLTPIQQDMEAAIAKKAGAPYKARTVTFHLPDFIDIVFNAGDDRNPLGATIGESLPNWGPVANEGRGRTVAMVNLYQDADSRDARKRQAESLLDAASMKLYSSTEPGLLGTILHEATHNLGPAHEYKIAGKTDRDVFGGPLASMLEELKAQTGALFLLDFIKGKGLITDEQAGQSYTDDIVWAFGHISQGMYDGGGKAKPYGNLAAIQMGFLIDKGALTWDANATAANGKDKGAFTIHPDKMAAAADELMKAIAGIKGRGDAKAAKDLIARYVDASDVVPHKVISERFLREPKASFVYAIGPQ